MGLALVEFALAVEHAFGLQIADEEWKPLETPAALGSVVAGVAGARVLADWSPWAAFALVFVAAWLLGLVVTRPLPTQAAEGFETVGQAAWTLGLRSERFGGAHLGWTQEEIETTVIALIRDQFRASAFDMDARFAELEGRDGARGGRVRSERGRSLAGARARVPMTRSFVRDLALGVLLVAGGCGKSLSHFDTVGFHSAENPYSIRYADAGQALLISPEWRVTNFEYEDGRPSRPITEGDFESSLTWSFKGGESDTVQTETFELRLSHNTNATIWVRLLPIPNDLLHKKVEFLAENFVNNLSGSAYNDYLGAGVDERRVATQILESKTIGFQGHHAHVVTFDLVSVDQLQLDQNAPRTRVEMVLVRTSFLKTLRNSFEFQAPAYLLLGYSNDAAQFESQLATFRSFTQQIEIRQAGQ